VTVTLTPSMLPEGWTIELVLWRSLEQKDLETETMGTFHVGCKTSAPDAFDIADLACGKTYVASQA
jgi:hypothetical protein